MNYKLKSLAEIEINEDQKVIELDEFSYIVYNEYNHSINGTFFAEYDTDYPLPFFVRVRGDSIDSRIQSQGDIELYLIDFELLVIQMQKFEDEIKEAYEKENNYEVGIRIVRNRK